MKAAASFENKTGAELVGINMEGPFISPAKKGAQNGIYIHNPDIGMVPPSPGDLRRTHQTL